MNEPYYQLKIGHLSTNARVRHGEIDGLYLHPFTDAELARAVKHAKGCDDGDVAHLEIEEGGGPIGDGVCLSIMADIKRDLVDDEIRARPLASVWLTIDHARMLHAALGAVLRMNDTMEKCEGDE